MKMPFYATPEQFAVSMNKKRFKEQCRKCGISVAEEYLAQNKEDLDKTGNILLSSNRQTAMQAEVFPYVMT